MSAELKQSIKKILPKSLLNVLRVLRDLKDVAASIYFISEKNSVANLRERCMIVKKIYLASFNLDSPHSQREILEFIRGVFRLDPNLGGVLVEAGCYMGSSTAKFSLAADLTGRELVVFDSFQGIPKHDELHTKNIFGGLARFDAGDYRASLAEVKENVSRYGIVDRCRFFEGWFENSLPKFKEPIVAIYLDVDLASSTKTCLKYLYPLLVRGGVLYSQDGHLPLVIDVLSDEDFWLKEVGCPKPNIEGLGKRKLIRIVKK